MKNPIPDTQVVRAIKGIVFYFGFPLAHARKKSDVRGGVPATGTIAPDISRYSRARE